MKKKILFICGSMNQTTQMHQIAGWLTDYEQYFSPFFSDGLLGVASDAGLLEFTIMGRKRSERTLDYLSSHHLRLDIGGFAHAYDLVVTCTDLIVPKHIRSNKIVLVQEGMTEPETILYHLARNFQWIPRWIAGTAATGLSDAYEKFFVAYESLKPISLIKNTLAEITSSPYLIENMLGAVLYNIEKGELDVLIEIIWDILVDNNLIPEPPASLSGAPIKVVYVSILAQAMRALGIQNINRVIGFVTQYASISPEAAMQALDNCDVDEQVREVNKMPVMMRRNSEGTASCRF